jgi:hypothetical protein
VRLALIDKLGRHHAVDGKRLSEQVRAAELVLYAATKE